MATPRIRQHGHHPIQQSRHIDDLFADDEHVYEEEKVSERRQRAIKARHAVEERMAERQLRKELEDFDFDDDQTRH